MGARRHRTGLEPELRNLAHILAVNHLCDDPGVGRVVIEIRRAGVTDGVEVFVDAAVGVSAAAGGDLQETDDLRKLRLDRGFNKADIGRTQRRAVVDSLEPVLGIYLQDAARDCDLRQIDRVIDRLPHNNTVRDSTCTPRRRCVSVGNAYGLESAGADQRRRWHVGR